MDPAETIRRLGLVPHPEGGHYRETYRSVLMIDLPDGRRRPASTAIHYLLTAGSRSAWHRVSSDEIWHHYDGGPLRLHLLGAGTMRLERSNPQAVVPAGTWQAAEPEGEGVLCGCTVAPGFDFADFHMGSEEVLVRDFPEHGELVRRFLR
ncbi:cupin domain-containing protein [soil metagenome]